MSDELKLHKDADRGAKAVALLDSELFKSTFAELEQQYVDRWLAPNQALNDETGRERLWMAVQILRHVRQHIERVAADGRLAEEELRSLAEGANPKS